MRRKVPGSVTIALALLTVLIGALAFAGPVAADGVANTRITSGPSGTIFTGSATFTFNSPEADDDADFQCRLDSTGSGDWSWCSSPKTYTALAEGSHSFEVRAVNRPGHPDPTPAVATFTVVTQPPQTTIVSAPVGTIASASAEFAFGSSQSGGFECRLDTQQEAAWAPCSSPQSYPGLGQGQHTFEVRAVNGGGKADPTPAAASFAVDTEPPETTLTLGPSGTIATDSAIFGFASSEEGSFECRFDSGDAAAWSPCSTPVLYSSLADGPHSFEVRALDAVGNVDPTPAAGSFTVDTTAPQTTIVAGPSGTIGSAAASFEFAASEPATFECRLDSSDAAAWSPCASPRPYSSLADGAHRFEVRATDAVGNRDQSPAVDDFSVYTGPPKPVAGESVNLEPVEGNVELQCPGENQYSPLTGFKQVPLGCLVNTRNGTVDLTASKGSSGELQGAHFWGGVFIVSQESGDNQPVGLKLAGKRMCERRGGRRHGSATTSASKGGGRKLWGSGKGNYTTNGNFGSATVRGTTWLVVDRCDASTLFQVAEGTVWVRDFAKNKTIVLEAGQQYLAKAPIPRLNPDIWH